MGILASIRSALSGASAEPSAVAGGAHDGAALTGRDMMAWQPPIMSADAEILPDLDIMVARGRDTARNNPIVSNAVATTKNSVVGDRYMLNAKPHLAALGAGFDEAWEEAFQEEVETKFGLYAESMAREADAEGVKTLTDIVRLGVGSVVVGGEFLATLEWLPNDPMRVFATAVQCVDHERLSNPFHTYDTATLRGGVERDARGKVVAYHIRTRHPNDPYGMDGDEGMAWKRVPAAKPWGRPMVLHVFEQMRPDQTRGIAAMSSALREMRMTSKFQDTVLQNAILRASYAASIESELPSAEIFQKMGASNAGDLSKEVGEYSKGFLQRLGMFTKTGKANTHNGVKVPHFHPGTKLNIHQLGDGGPLGTEFENSLLRKIAAALGISYEELSKNFSDTNYSSARAAMAQTWKATRAMKRGVADRIASTVYRAWLEEAVNTGQIVNLPAAARRPGWLYHGQNFDALAGCDWIGASRGQIDELKETQAAALRLSKGMSTQEEECARLGLDWRVVNRQLERERIDRMARGLDEPATTKSDAALSRQPRHTKS